MKKIKVSKETRKRLEDRKTTVVDIGCGATKQKKEWFGIDYRKLDGVDLVQDLESFTAIASHVVEHIQPTHGIFISFMNSVWRILKPGGEFLISAPYATSPGMFRDPTHCNFVNEQTWAYFDPMDVTFGSGLYNIYAPLPWRVKANTWHMVGNLEIVMVRREIIPEYKVDKEYLRILKEHTKLTK